MIASKKATLLLSGFFLVFGKRTLPALILVLLGCLVPLSTLKIDNSIEVWFFDDPDSRQRYDDLVETFGTDDFLIFAFKQAGDTQTPQDLESLRRVTLEIESLPAVDSAFSLSTYLEEATGVKQDEPFTNDLVEEIQAEVDACPLLQGDLYSKNNKTFGIIAELSGDVRLKSRELKSAVKSLIETEFRRGLDIKWGGVRSVGFELDTTSNSELALRFPVGILAGSTVCFLIGVPLAHVVAVFVTAGASVVLTLALFAGTGHTMNMVTTILPSVVFFLSLAFGIHIAHGIGRFGHGRRRIPALARLIPPLMGAAVTTMIGFSALAVSDFTVVVTLGVYTAVGVLIAALLNLIYLPAIIVRRDKSGTRLLRWKRPETKVVLTFTSLAFLACIPFLTNITTRMDPLEFMPSSSRLVQDHLWIENHLAGLAPLEILVKLPSESRSTEAPTLRDFQRLSKLSQWIESQPGVSRVVTGADWMRRFNQNRLAVNLPQKGDYRLPDSEDQFNRDLVRGVETVPQVKRFVDLERRRLRVHVRTTLIEAEAYEALRAAIENKTRELLPGSLASSYGLHARIKIMESHLLASQARALGIAWVLVSLLLVGLAPNVTIGLLAIIPNTLPVILVFATMGALGIPLDLGTMMVTSITMGFAVDDTFHIMSRYGNLISQGLDHTHALDQTLATSGIAVIQTSVLLTTLFCVLATSVFVPISRFGMLVAIAVVAALILDLLLLPALLDVRASFDRSAGDRTV